MSAGLAPFGALSPADIARLMQQARPQVDVSADAVPAAIPPGFTGFVPPTAPTMQPQVAAAPAVEPEAPVRAPLRMFGALPPQMSAPVAAEPERSPLPSLVGSRAPALPVSAPAGPRGGDDAPAAPARPLSFGNMPSGAPAQPAPAPAAPAPPITGSVAASPAPAAPEPASAGSSFFGRLGDPRVANVLLGISQGLLSTKGFGAGIAAGIGAASKLNKDQAVTDLAQSEFNLKARKDAQEQRQLTGNAQYVTSKIPGISPEQALTLGGNSTFMNELFKGVLPPTELYRQYTDADGNRWNRNERTGQETVALKKDEDKTVTPVPEADRVALGLPAGSYQKDANGKISPINATGTTINMGAEKAQDATVGKAYGDYQVDLATKGRNAGNTLNSLALMEQAARNPNFYSGTGAETVKRANQFLIAMGVKDANYTKPTEVFDALSNKVVLDGLGGSLGLGISNTDRDYIGRTAPTLAQSQAGNLELIAIARSLAQRQQAVSKLARDYAANNGGRLDSGFDQKLEEYAGANPLFPAAQAAATQRSDGATGANGPGGIAAPRTQADFDALPKGAMYVDPADGRRYRKN